MDNIRGVRPANREFRGSGSWKHRPGCASLGMAARSVRSLPRLQDWFVRRQNPNEMKVLRFIIAIAALLFVWLVVSAGVGWLVGIVFQPKSEAHFFGFWLDWHALPGLAIGFVMGVRAFRTVAGAGSTK